MGAIELRATKQNQKSRLDASSVAMGRAGQVRLPGTACRAPTAERANRRRKRKEPQREPSITRRGGRLLGAQARRNACATERRRYEGPEVALLNVEGVAGFVFADLVAEVVVDGF